MPESKIIDTKIIKTKCGTNCIICNSFIEVRDSYFGRRSDEYVCKDCKNVIMALKQIGEIGVQRILTVLNETREEK